MAGFLRVIHGLAALEMTASALSAYYFAGGAWASGSMLALAALALYLRAEKRMKEEYYAFAMAKNRICDAMLLSGFALGNKGHILIGLAALFSVLILTNIAGLARKIRGHESHGPGRKRMLAVIAIAGLAEKTYAWAAAAGLLLIIGLAMVDFFGALRRPVSKKAYSRGSTG